MKTIYVTYIKHEIKYKAVLDELSYESLKEREDITNLRKFSTIDLMEADYKGGNSKKVLYG